MLYVLIEDLSELHITTISIREKDCNEQFHFFIRLELL